MSVPVSPGALQVLVSVGTVFTIFPKYQDADGEFSTPACDQQSAGFKADTVLAWLTTITTWLCVFPLLHVMLAIVR